jgi:hypothetical protein
MLDTSSREYVEWMAGVWKANDDRNKQLASIKGTSILGKHSGVLPDDIYELFS